MSNNQEIIQTSKKPTKICLKCNRGLREGQTVCSNCGCTDIIRKADLKRCIDVFNRADSIEKEKLSHENPYFLIIKYGQITHYKNTSNTNHNNEKTNDTLIALGGLVFVVLAIILGIAVLLATSNFFIALIPFSLFMYLSYICQQNVSPKTWAAVRNNEKAKKEQELNGGYLCPNCGKKAGHEISVVKKSVSVATFGLASNKIGKTYECKNCKYKW